MLCHKHESSKIGTFKGQEGTIPLSMMQWFPEHSKTLNVSLVAKNATSN